MFNLEVRFTEGVFQICDDIVSEKLTMEEAKNCVITLYKDFLHDFGVFNSSYTGYGSEKFDINFYLVWDYTEEEIFNIKFNLALLNDFMDKIAEEIFIVHNKYENNVCGSAWSALTASSVALCDFRYNNNFA